MKQQMQDSSSGTSNGDESQRSAWSMPLFWGVLLGASVALVAGIRRWFRLAADRTSPWPGEGDVIAARLPPDQPLQAAGAMPASGAPAQEPGVGPTPGAPAQEPGARPTPQQKAKARTMGPPRPEPAAQAAHPGAPALTAPTRWREPTKYVVGVGLFLTMLFLLYISRSVIPTVIVAALLAMVIHPVIDFLQRRLKVSRGLAIAITYLLIILLLVLIPLIVVPTVIDAVNGLVNIDFQAWADSASQAIRDLADQVESIPVVNSLLKPFLDSMSNALQGVSATPAPEPVSYDVAMGSVVDGLSRTLGIVARVLGPVVSAVISVVFMLLISLHLSLSGHRILEGYPQLLPPAYAPEIRALIDRLGEVWVSFLRGQFALMVLIGVVVWLGNAILGNRYPWLLGIVSGTMEIIPNLGPALALVPGVGFALIFGSSHFAIDPLVFAVIVLAFYLLVQVMENNLVVPYVLGGELEVPPLAVILGVMIGGTVAGILGVLLATPFIATGREIFSYLYDKILEVPESPEPEEEKPSFLASIGGRIRNLGSVLRRRSEQPPVSDAGTG